MPVFALVDCNNFFVSCERAFNPALRNKPVAVLSNNDGCIVARSNEVKKLGIPMGAPYFQWRGVCEANGVAVLSSNYQLYSDMSARVMRIISEFCPETEMYSVDEAFIDLTSYAPHMNIREFCTKLRETILQMTGIPVSIGIAGTKTLAKLANHIAKKKTSSGVYVMPSPQDSDELLSYMPVEEVWGVGRNMGPRLRDDFGIYSVLDLRDAEPKKIRKAFSVLGERIIYELRGISCLSLEDMDEPGKTIVASRSFGKHVTDCAELEESIAWHVSRAAERLRAQGSKAGGIVVSVKSGGAEAGQYRSVHVPLLPATSDTPHMIAKAKEAVRAVYRDDVYYKKSGVCLYDISPASRCQGDILLDKWEDTPERRDIAALTDTVNRTMGEGTIVFAAEGLRKDWRMSCSRRSPHYTTDWNELLRV